MEGFRTRWLSLVPRAPRDAALAVFDALVRAYEAPGRHYHNLGHIGDCLTELDAARELADDPRAVELAIWFHDAIYDATRDDNEARSAELAAGELSRLGEPDDLVGRVHGLILDTRHAAPPATPDGRLLCDIDLVGLAAPPDAFDRNTALIRQEYAHVPDAAFRRGRADFLRNLSARPRIYHTPCYFDRCERRARGNLDRAIAALAG